MLNRTPKESAKKTKSVPRHIDIIIIAFFVALCISLAGTISVQESRHQANAPSSSSATCKGLEVSNRCVALERADTASKRTQGLSGRDNLPDNTGMLFVFDQSEQVCMWMKDMKFDLDMVWLNDQKQVIHIEKGVSPSTYPQSFCQDNAKYVLEFTAGDVQILAISDGQQLTF